MPEEFDLLLEEALDQNPEGKMDRAQQCINRIGQLENDLQMAKRDLQCIVEDLIMELGAAIKRNEPRLKVESDGGSLVCSYKTKSLAFCPDLAQKIWKLAGGDPKQQRLGRKFRRGHGHALGLRDDMGTMAEAVSGFFRDTLKFKTLTPIGAGRPIQPTRDMGKGNSGGHYA